MNQFQEHSVETTMVTSQDRSCAGETALSSCNKILGELLRTELFTVSRCEKGPRNILYLGRALLSAMLSRLSAPSHLSEECRRQEHHHEMVNSVKRDGMKGEPWYVYVRSERDWCANSWNAATLSPHLSLLNSKMRACSTGGGRHITRQRSRTLPQVGAV